MFYKETVTSEPPIMQHFNCKWRTEVAASFLKLLELSMTLDAAIKVLKRAVELDEDKSFSEALVCYQEGMELLMNVLKDTKDAHARRRYREQMNSYLERATKLKEFVKEKKKAGEYHEQIKIPDEAVGYSYARIFGPYLDENVEEVIVEDPYVRSVHQIYNFLRLCELFVLKGKVRVIRLVTGRHQQPLNHRKPTLSQI